MLPQCRRTSHYLIIYWSIRPSSLAVEKISTHANKPNIICTNKYRRSISGVRTVSKEKSLIKRFVIISYICMFDWFIFRRIFSRVISTSIFLVFYSCFPYRQLGWTFIYHFPFSSITSQRWNWIASACFKIPQSGLKSINLKFKGFNRTQIDVPCEKLKCK